MQRPAGCPLLVGGHDGRIDHWRRADFVRLFHPGDLVIANDAATLPASLTGRHVPDRTRRLKCAWPGRDSLAQVTRFSAVLFGAGDFRTRTEDRPLPPRLLTTGDRLTLGPLHARVVGLHHHPRLVAAGVRRRARHGLEGARPARPTDPGPRTWPRRWRSGIRGLPSPHAPVAFEPPSAGFVLDWASLAAMAKQGVHFATITHAAGISSTGDPDLDALLPFDEPYRIPASTAAAIAHARRQGQRVIAIGTTVVRALEHAAGADGIVRAGEGVASQKIGPSTQLRIVSAILSGTHEPRHESLRNAARVRGRGDADAHRRRHWRRRDTGRTSSVIRSFSRRRRTPGGQVGLLTNRSD